MNISKKLAVLTASGLATVTVAGGAFAYFTATGEGSGAATVGNESPWRIHNVNTEGAPSGLLPGWGGQQAVNYTVTNDSDGVQRLNSVVVTIKREANDSASVFGAPGCLASWFNVMTSWAGTDFAPLGSFNADQSRTGKAVLGMSNVDANQDACKGKAIPVIISAS